MSRHSGLEQANRTSQGFLLANAQLAFVHDMRWRVPVKYCSLATGVNDDPARATDEQCPWSRRGNVYSRSRSVSE